MAHGKWSEVEARGILEALKRAGYRCSSSQRSLGSFRSPETISRATASHHSMLSMQGCAVAPPSAHGPASRPSSSVAT